MNISRISLDWYQTSLNHSCLLPDLGVDESLLRYSGLNSTAQLQDYSDQLILTAPGFAQKLGPALGSVAQIPNAVGLNALVISLILDAVANRTSGFHRVFGEETAPGVQRTVTDYVKRHRKRINDELSLRYELPEFELQLSTDLLVLWNALVDEVDMSSQTLKTWVNGAWFHLLMQIHMARLHSQRLRPDKEYCTRQLSYNIDLFGDHLDYLMIRYKRYWTKKTEVSVRLGPDGSTTCFLINKEHEDVVCEKPLDFTEAQQPCNSSVLIEAYVNHLFSHYEPIFIIKSHLLNVQNNLKRLIYQHHAFTLPPPPTTTD